MSYIKLCQIISQGNPDSNGKDQTVYYQEDCEGNNIINSILTYPITFQVEVIDWDSLDNFQKRIGVVQFNQENVTLNVLPASPDTIRKEIFNQLVVKYPSLVI